jgi:hypothetical protein
MSEAPFMAQLDAFKDLIETAPTTFAGLRAWASYLDEIRDVDQELLEWLAPSWLCRSPQRSGIWR